MKKRSKLILRLKEERSIARAEKKQQREVKLQEKLTKTHKRIEFLNVPCVDSLHFTVCLVVYVKISLGLK